MSSPIIGDNTGRRTSLKRRNDSDHFTNTESPSSCRKIDVDCSPPKKVRFSDHFPALSKPGNPLTEVNLKQHNKRIVFAEGTKDTSQLISQTCSSRTVPCNCVMKAWLDDRYDFEWIWASKGGSGSTEDSSHDMVEDTGIDQRRLWR